MTAQMHTRGIDLFKVEAEVVVVSKAHTGRKYHILPRDNMLNFFNSSALSTSSSRHSLQLDGTVHVQTKQVSDEVEMLLQFKRAACAYKTGVYVGNNNFASRAPTLSTL